jgi:hypothetical protein
MVRKSFALIGAGLWGEMHAQAYRSHPEAQLAAVRPRSWPGEAGLEVTRVACAVEQSAKTGEPVVVER